MNIEIAKPVKSGLIVKSFDTKSPADSSNIKPAAIYKLFQELELTLKTFLPEAQAKKVDLSLNVTKDLPVAFWDMDSLRRHVLNNILSNAIRHTPIGGKIAIHADILDNYTAVITISDSGSRLSASENENLFQGASELDSSRDSRRSGLNDALRCINAHQGIIRCVETPEFPGVTFKIELPLYKLCIQ